MDLSSIDFALFGFILSLFYLYWLSSFSWNIYHQREAASQIVLGF